MLTLGGRPCLSTRSLAAAGGLHSGSYSCTREGMRAPSTSRALQWPCGTGRQTSAAATPVRPVQSTSAEASCCSCCLGMQKILCPPCC